MLTGMPPFYNKDRQKLFNSIKAIKIKYNDIKSHPFFAEIDWDNLLAKKIKPPFIPKLKNISDVKYIDKEFTSLPVKDSDNSASESLNPEEDPYGGFSYDPNKNNENENNI